MRITSCALFLACLLALPARTAEADASKKPEAEQAGPAKPHKPLFALPAFVQRKVLLEERGHHELLHPAAGEKVSVTIDRPDIVLTDTYFGRYRGLLGSGDGRRFRITAGYMRDNPSQGLIITNDIPAFYPLAILNTPRAAGPVYIRKVEEHTGRVEIVTRGEPRLPKEFIGPPAPPTGFVEGERFMFDILTGQFADQPRPR